MYPSRKPLGLPPVDNDALAQILGKSAAQLIHLVVERAQSENYLALLVGGVVRDLVMGKRNLDLDFVLEGDAIGLARTLATEIGGDFQFHPPFLTAKWILDEQTVSRLGLTAEETPKHIDIATARSESYASPAALPSVRPGTIEQDLQRRDFAMNALALRYCRESHLWHVLDLHEGLADLQNGRIRILHDRSFLDDPTRIFRAYRYAYRYDFDIDARTGELLQDAVAMVSCLSGERIRNELAMIIREAEPEHILFSLNTRGVLNAIHPALHAAHCLQLLFARCRVHQPPWAGSRNDESRMYWHLWMINLAVADITAISARLGLTKELTASIAAGAGLLSNSEELREATALPSQITRLLDGVPADAVHAGWISLWDEPIIRQRLESYMGMWRHRRPITDGNALIQLGLKQGPRYREILDTLRFAWIDGEIESEADERDLLKTLLTQED